jgi:hypothetical protein
MLEIASNKFKITENFLIEAKGEAIDFWKISEVQQKTLENFIFIYKRLKTDHNSSPPLSFLMNLLGRDKIIKVEKRSFHLH